MFGIVGCISCTCRRIQRELDEAEAKKAESVARRREIKEQKKLSQPRQLSQNKFIPQPTEFKLTEELADSLRTLKVMLR